MRAARPEEPVAPPPGRATLARRLREQLGPPPRLDEWPPVSIVVLNRDGEAHLRRLLPRLAAATDYPRLELILVDNASRDGSVAFARSQELPFPVTIVENDRNLSFADANDDGAERAAYEHLLFLNNDVEPFEPGWLKELVACLEDHRAAAAGATLLYGAPPRGASRGDYVIQHRGVVFALEAGRLIPLTAADGEALHADRLADAPTPALTAAALLVRRSAFELAGGFTTGFQWGWEDVDLGLKLTGAGERLVCSGRSVLFHHYSSTRFREGREWRRRTRALNQRLFTERWGPQARREYLLERFAEGRRFWTDGRPPLLAVLPPRERAGEADVLRLCDAVEAEGWRTAAVEADDEQALRIPDDADFVLAADPAAAASLPLDACTVLWVRERPDAWLATATARRAELVLVSSLRHARTLEAAGIAPVLLSDPGDAPRLIALLRERTQRLRFCLKLSREWTLEPAALALRRSLEAHEHACSLQLADEWELLAGAAADVAVALGDPGGYVPRPAQLNVLWSRRPPAPTVCDAWDLVLVPDREAASSLRAETPTEAAAFDLERSGEPAEPLLDLVARAAARDGVSSGIATHRSQSSTSRA